MNNLDVTNMTEDEIIEHCKPFIRKIIGKYYKNHAEFTHVHMISFEELEHFGMIGVMEALRTYDPARGARLSTHTINRVVSAINRYSKKASLRNVNNYSYDLVDTVSLNSKVKAPSGDLEELIYFLPEQVDSFETKDNDIVIEQAIKKLMNVKYIPLDYIAFLVCRMQGDNIVRISEKFGISGYHVKNIMREFEAIASNILEVGYSNWN